MIVAKFRPWDIFWSLISRSWVSTSKFERTWYFGLRLWVRERRWFDTSSNRNKSYISILNSIEIAAENKINTLNTNTSTQNYPDASVDGSLVHTQISCCDTYISCYLNYYDTAFTWEFSIKDFAAFELEFLIKYSCRLLKINSLCSFDVMTVCRALIQWKETVHNMIVILQRFRKCVDRILC